MIGLSKSFRAAIGAVRELAPDPVDPQFCGPCGSRFDSRAELLAHARSCWAPQAVEADAVRMLSAATVGLAGRVPAAKAPAVTFAVQRAGRGLSPEQRARLAWLVTEFTDLLPAPGVAS